MLEPDFPASPSRPPRYVLYCDNLQSGRRFITNAVGRYAAKKLFEAVVGDGEGELPFVASYMGPRTELNHGHIRVRSDDLLAIACHQYTEEEAEYQLPSNIARTIEAFRLGGSPAPSEPVRTPVAARPATNVAPVVNVVPRAVREPSSRAVDAADDLGRRVAELTSNGPSFDRPALEAFAKLNGAWRDSDDKLSNGLARMTVVNRLRGKVKRGEAVKWPVGEWKEWCLQNT